MMETWQTALLCLFFFAIGYGFGFFPEAIEYLKFRRHVEAKLDEMLKLQADAKEKS